MRRKTKELNTRAYDTLFLFLLVVSIALRFYYFIGLNFSDDQAYVELANRIKEGTYVLGTDPLSQRIGITYPIAFFYFLLGVSEFSASLYPLISFVALMVITYVLTAKMFDKLAALIAAYFLAIFPLFVEYATMPMGDIPLALFAALSMLCFIYARFTHRNTLFLLSGISAGVAYLIKLLGLVILLPLFVYFLIDITTARRKLRVFKPYLFFLLGVLLAVSFEFTLDFIFTGNPLLRLDAVNYFSSRERLSYEFNTDLSFYPKLLFPYTFSGYDGYFSFFFYLVAVAIIYFIVKRDNRTTFLVFWLLVVLLYMQFGTMSLKEWIFMHRLERHLTIILPASSIISAAFLSRLINRYRYFFLPVTFLILFLLTVKFSQTWSATHEYHVCAKEDLKLVYEVLKRERVKTIIADFGEIAHLNFYFGFPHNITFKNPRFTPCSEVHDAYVIINGTRYWYDVLFRSNKIGECYKKPPKEWKLVKKIKGECGGLFAKYDAAVYYAP